MNNWRIRICQGVNCQNYLSEDLYVYAQKLVNGHPEITIEKRGCMNRCAVAPNMQIINEETGESEIVTGVTYQIIEEKIRSLV